MKQSNLIKSNNKSKKDSQQRIHESINDELYFNKKELVDEGHCADDEFFSEDNIKKENKANSPSTNSVEENKEVKLNNNNKEKEKSPDSKGKFIVYNFFNPIINNKEKNNIKKNNFFISRKRRKEMNDNIFKKIKSNFFKSIRKILIERIKKYNNKECNFKFNQEFIRDVSFKENKSIFEEKLYNFIEKKIKMNNKKDDKEDILQYVRNDKIGQMTLEDLFKEYLDSKEFEDNINKVRNEKNINRDYINKYILKAKDFVNHYKEGKNHSQISLKTIDKNLFVPLIDDINIFDDSEKSINSSISINEPYNFSPLFDS